MCHFACVGGLWGQRRMHRHTTRSQSYRKCGAHSAIMLIYDQNVDLFFECPDSI